MAWYDGITDKLGGSMTTNVLIGAAAVVLAPIVVPAVVAGMRPLAKAAVKGGVIVFDKTREVLAETGEQVSDLVAEARAELAASAAASAAARSAAASPENPYSPPESSYES